MEQSADEEDVSIAIARALSLVPRDARVRALIREFYGGEEDGERGWANAAVGCG